MRCRIASSRRSRGRRSRRYASPRNDRPEVPARGGPQRYRSAVIRPLDPVNDSAACDAIVASLPDWFGLEEGIRECAEAVRTQPGLAAEVDGEVSGFLTIARPYPQTPEISWLAVHARDRRRGIGRALIVALSDQLRTHGDRLVLVKTLSDRTDPGPEYAETRAFYLAMGFVPVAELNLDPPDPENPIQLLAMTL